MPARTIRLFHWKAEEAAPLIEKLRRAGYDVAYQEAGGVSIKAMQGASVAVIDLSRLPSQGRAVAAWLRGSKTTRQIPIVFLDGDPAKVEAIKKQIPDAVYTTDARLSAALKKALSQAPPPAPVVPRQMMEGYEYRSIAQKLGIAENAVVRVIEAPADYRQILGSLPAGVTLMEESRGSATVTLWFVRDVAGYEAQLPAHRRLASKTRLWIAWPKGRKDINENLIRDPALALGLVDYKICSLSNIWSAIAFALRKTRGKT